MQRVEGVSAGRLDLLGRVISVAAVAIGLVAAIVAVAARPGAVTLVALLVVVALGLGVGQVVRLRASGIARREAALGYSTLDDVPGYEFRDARTGEVIRPADAAPMGNPSARVYDTLRRPTRDERQPPTDDAG